MSSIGKKESVWEFKTNHCRGLFVTDDEERNLVFVKVKGERFFSPSACPWPH